MALLQLTEEKLKLAGIEPMTFTLFNWCFASVPQSSCQEEYVDFYPNIFHIIYLTSY